MSGWSVGAVTVRFRYSRSADFSGACHYRDGRIYVNIGAHLRFPYRLATHVARAVTIGRRWYKPLHVLELGEGFQLAGFIFHHELYHLLVRRARRNVRQKESMCDRFATRYVVDTHGLEVRDRQGHPVPRAAWDFQDLEGFVAAAKRRDRAAARRPVRPAALAAAGNLAVKGQLLLFGAV